jgi:hypothetical protein
MIPEQGDYSLDLTAGVDKCADARGRDARRNRSPADVLPQCPHPSVSIGFTRNRGGCDASPEEWQGEA